MENILEIKDLTIQYRADNRVVEAVNKLNLTLGKGESLGLVGETGAGKTTTALGIMGLIPDPPGIVTGGEILFEGEDLLKQNKKKMRSIRGKKISMIFQDPMTSLNPVMTVGSQIAESIRIHEKCSKADAAVKAVRMLELVGIPGERYGEYPHQFSGGMKQRVVIAIALSCNPELLLADEPTTALDVTIQAQVLDLIVKLKKENQTSMILITHDLGIVAEVCDKVAIMYAGEIVEYGNLEQIYNHTCHPYTKGLFGSIPDLDSHVKRLNPIPGLMPDPADLPAGCSFCPRCACTCSRCQSENPDMTEVEPGHFVKCFQIGKEEEHV
ncbi:MAG: ABC transporter ATP-binding protein [Lachnospiraceae bacterium]|jgi:peptide/nickel transport system ATP-binding protein|uniref:ABC transporter ATP-binding protein n=1 Tax=Candidatus Merdisoma sp. JLR.KK011 TaxID=3114299 RepID=UPI0029DA4719|nr:ABC transporter ATP-binding protein [Lachnospiraceae bacterium]MCI9251435.1 ABC transporter ATP-binding protein [Lachnospiraceae bacterium]MCI9382749.1 ABC transporter ATP-binding protein [Lachnospiraceae bacterium]MCI9478700.1 ABC transporter ATP-binding protein [Lachnospiraceae bacterium]MCI9623564.1 ABC transporter ATP-binding protein [Lachnospiraceae bacterium]